MGRWKCKREGKSTTISWEINKKKKELKIRKRMLNDITVDIAQWECNNNKSYASAFKYN